MQRRERERQDALRKDRLAWVTLVFGLMFYAALGTVIMLFAVGYGAR